MRQNPLYDEIDQKFLRAVDEIIHINTKLGIKPNKDSAIGRLIYPSNRSIISSVRSHAKHIPHVAIINFAKEFNVDMNYFYDTMTALQYQPETNTITTVSGNGINSSGDHAQNIHAGEGTIQTIHSRATSQDNGASHSPQISALMSDFIATIPAHQVPQFLAVISEIQKQQDTSAKKLHHTIEQQTLELKNLRAVFEQELKYVRDELKQTRQKLDDAQASEISLLKQLLQSKQT